MKRNVKNKKFINQIICANALELLPQIEDSSIDLVLTDPPYFLDKMDNSWKYKKVSSKKNQYTIKSLPAGMKFDSKQGKRFYNWYLKIAKEIYRILKPGAFFFSFSSPRLYHKMTSAIDDANFLIRDCFLWIYTQNQVKAMGLNHFINKLNTDKITKEKIKKKLQGWKTPQIKSCFEPIAVAQKPSEGTLLKNILKHEVGLFNTNIKVGKNMFPSNILIADSLDSIMDRYFLIPKPRKQEKGEFNGHQTVKPLAICEHLINLSTFSKDAIVLDPFIGSGTTAIAAKNLDKNFIGIDINPEYVAIAKKRLNYKFKTNLKLNL
ncbi:methyltransferase [Parcubacteria bacterium DG_74_2]|nr:MAG: methyltransferase [Parcubacteria bacterium DG_74_2]